MDKRIPHQVLELDIKTMSDRRFPNRDAGAARLLSKCSISDMEHVVPSLGQSILNDVTSWSMGVDTLPSCIGSRSASLFESLGDMRFQA